VLGMAFSALLKIVNAVNAQVGNFGRAFSFTTVGFMALSVIISLPCLLLVKQGDTEAETEKKEKVGWRDIVTIFKRNRAFDVHFVGVLVRNFVYTFMTATMAYYTKWAYCADITTGVVDNQRLGTITLVSSVIIMLPMLVSAVLSPMILKKLGSNVKVLDLANWISLAAGIVLFVMQITGVLQASFLIFSLLMGILAFGNGLCFVPTQDMWLECIDYNKEVTGKPMSGTISALSGFLGKTQAALATLVVGWVLAGIGYNVDSATGNYIGELSRIPAMLTWFVVVCALLPAICAFATLFIYKKYPKLEKAEPAADAAK
jgi:Na+/melibiose symporter-like transporter